MLSAAEQWMTMIWGNSVLFLWAFPFRRNSNWIQLLCSEGSGFQRQSSRKRQGFSCLSAAASILNAEFSFLNFPLFSLRRSFTLVWASWDLLACCPAKVLGILVLQFHFSLLAARAGPFPCSALMMAVFAVFCNSFANDFCFNQVPSSRFHCCKSYRHVCSSRKNTKWCIPLFFISHKKWNFIDSMQKSESLAKCGRFCTYFL